MALARYDDTAVDEAGNVIPFATVEVRRDVAGRPIVPLFSGREGTGPLGNPFQANEDGTFGFHAPGGAYYIRVYTGPSQNPTLQRVRRYVPIGTAGENDVESLATMLEAGTATFPTLAELEAFTPSGPGIGGKVTTGADAGFYHYDDVEEEWVFDRRLYDSLARMNVTGGDENDIEAEIASGVDDASVVMLWIEAPDTNTGPVSINGKSVLTTNDEEIAAGQWVAGRTYWFSDEGANYKLRTDSDVSDLVAAAEAAEAGALAAQAAAEAAAAGAGVTDGDKEGVIVSGGGTKWASKYDTKTTLAAKTLDASVDTILVTGSSAAGDDNDGDVVALVRTPAATVGFITDMSGAKFAHLSRTIKFGKMFHGANGDGVTDNTAAWAAVCAEIVAKGGGKIIVPPGVYARATGQSAFNMYCNVELEFHPDALFKGKSGITGSLINWRGAAGSARGDYKWEFQNVRLDQSLGAFTGNQPSGISPSNVREIVGYGGYFQGGANWEAAPTVGGDSAIEPINITDYRWDGGFFEGWIDAAQYVGGGNDLTATDDGIRMQIQNGFYRRCGQAITFKRDGNLLIAKGNYMEFCSIGITSADVGAGQEVDTGQRMEIEGNTIKKTPGRAIGVRGKTVANINDNLLEDWGYDTTGVTLGAGAPSLGRQAILFEGGIDSVVSNNRFRMKDWVENGHVGMLVKNYTDADAVVWPAGRLSGVGNRFNVSTPIYETTTNVSASYFSENRDEATLNLAVMRSGTVYKTSQPGNPRVITYKGNASNVGERTIELLETFSAYQTGTLLSSIGSLAATTTSSTVSIACVGAKSGDAVILTGNSSGSMNARLNYAMRAVTDQVDVQVRNDHSVAIDFTALSFTLMVIRRE